MSRKRAMTSADASAKKKAGHEREHEFAALINGTVNKGTELGKKYVTDQSDGTHLLKSGKWWQIFLYGRGRLESNTMLRGIGDLADIAIECIDVFPNTFDEHHADKETAKTALQTPMKKLCEELQKPKIYESFIKKVFFNDNEVDYLTIKSDEKFHVFEKSVVVNICNKFTVANSKAVRSDQMDDQKVLLKLGVNIGEIEIRKDSNQHYREFKFRINGEKFLKILTEEIGDNFEERDRIIVYGKARITFKKIHAKSSDNQTSLLDDEIVEIDDGTVEDELQKLVNNPPKPKTAPAFSLGNDNLFHITPSPDNQPVDRRDVLLKKLRETIEALLESLVGANAHQQLIPIIEEYRWSISGDQISISQVYWSGVKLGKAAWIIKRDIEAKEQPPLPFNTELNFETALEIHGAYIMLNKEGERLVTASAAYKQPAEQTKEIEWAIEKLSNTITESLNLFSADVREYVSDVLKYMGQGKHPERSNQSIGNTLTNLVSGILGWIKRTSSQKITDIIMNKAVESVLGTDLVAISIVATNAALLLVNIAPLLLIIIAPFAGELNWLASAAHLLERIRLMIESKKNN